MASLTKRAVILMICRVTNYGIGFLSPIFLVRIFDVHAYGQYREFLLYAMLFSGFMGFGINTNLLYFIPKYPGRERRSVTYTALFMLLASALGIIVVYFGRGLLLSKASFDFVLPLIFYLFFFLNLDFYESYWLGKKRSDFVLYYSAARDSLRVISVVVAAYFSHSVLFTIKVLVVIEFLKCIFLFFAFRKLFIREFDSALLKEQARFILPIGIADIINKFNYQIAKLVILIAMGVENLALYTIGSYQIPIISIVRSSVMDVLFPEMAQREEDSDRLELWQKATIVFCFIVFPLFVVFFYYAKLIIVTLFTEQYLAAVPLFQIYLLLMILQCFEMSVPLRAINQNKYFIIENILNLVVNVGLIMLLFRSVGFLAPAIAFILGYACAVVYLGLKILKFYGRKISNLLTWRKVFLLAVSCIVAFPVLLLGEIIPIDAIARAILFSVAYLILYYVIARIWKIEEVGIIVSKVAVLLRKMPGSGTNLNLQC